MTDLALLPAVAAAGGVGSALRFLADRALSARVRASYPWGITLVNISGSFVFGVVVGLAALPETARTVLGAGLLGGYTTFSTASADTVTLLGRGRAKAAAANAVGMLLACVAAAIAGLVIAGR